MKQILILACATFFNVLSFAVLVPVLPYAILDFGGSAFEAGAIFSCFSLCSFLVGTLWGRASDYFGRKAVLLICIAVTFFSYFIILYSHDVWHLFIARGMAGLAGGWLIGAQSLVSDVLNEDKRAKGMGLLGASFGVGFTIGPALGGYVSILHDQQLFYPALFALLFSAICFFIALIFLREPEKKAHYEAINFVASLRNIQQHHYLFFILISYFTVQFAFTITEGTLALWVNSVLAAGPRTVGYILAIAGICSIIIQGGLIGRLVKKFGEARVIMFGIITVFAGVVSVLFSDDMLMLSIAIALIACGLGMYNPANQSLISRKADAHSKGLALGLAQSLSSLARAIGPALGGFLFQYNTISPYILSLLFLTLTIVIFTYNKKHA